MCHLSLEAVSVIVIVFFKCVFLKCIFKSVCCPICYLSRGAVSVPGIDSFKPHKRGTTPFNLKQKTLLTFSTVGHKINGLIRKYMFSSLFIV